MDPFYEQGLRDEVLYLHSLWRQGPPRNHHHHHHNLNPYSYPPTTTDSQLRDLRPTHPIQFKKNKHKTKLNLVEQHIKNRSQPPIDPGPEWPIPKSPENVPLSSSGWPPLNLPPATQLPSPDDQARFASSKLQQKTMKAVRDFFTAGNADDDDDDADADDDNSEEKEGDDPMEDDERKEYNFFLNIFMEDSDLKNYYKSKCKGGGEFFCLVCGGIASKGKGGTKRFKNCLALVQHSLSITKTKKMRAHRAYAEVICKLIDWDINQLSSYSSMIAMSGDSEIQTPLQAVTTDSNGESLQNVVANNVVVLPVSNLAGLSEVTNNVEGSFVNNNPTENAVSSTGGDASKQEATAVNALCGKISSNMVLETM